MLLSQGLALAVPSAERVSPDFHDDRDLSALLPAVMFMPGTAQVCGVGAQ